MYPSSSSSSSHCSMSPSGGGGGGLTRYGSAPGSILTTAVDSLIGPNLGTQVGPTRFFSTESNSLSLRTTTPDQSTCNTTATRPTTKVDPTTAERNGGGGGGSSNSTAGLQRSYCLNEFATAFNDLKNRNGGGSSSPGLVRHRSSPADFLDSLTDKGFQRGIGSFNPKGNSDAHVSGISRLNSQLSFTRQDSLSQISEESENAINCIGADGHRKASHSYTTASYNMGSWDDANMFPSPQSKRAKNSSNNIVNGLNIVESQFGPSQSALEMAAMESLMEIPQDSVPCKIRAKRGCATHPRSIAERERRTRISGKLKKLQDLVPNMDKQTSYADMLDLAVQHIKGLQTQVQDLNHELENCTCGSKQTS